MLNVFRHTILWTAMMNWSEKGKECKTNKQKISIHAITNLKPAQTSPRKIKAIFFNLNTEANLFNNSTSKWNIKTKTKCFPASQRKETPVTRKESFVNQKKLQNYETNWNVYLILVWRKSITHLKFEARAFPQRCKCSCIQHLLWTCDHK